MIQPSFRALLFEAIREFAEHGYRSEADLSAWLMRLHAALEREMPADGWVRQQLEAALGRIFNREVKTGGLLKRVPGVSRYTLDRISPTLRAELDRRIFAGIDLIRLNRRAAVEKTLQRFAGWVSSVPRGGSHQTDIRSIAAELAKPAKQVRFEARRVAIDQGHKLSAAVAHVAAAQAGAIGGIWHDRGERDHGYDARPEHLKRSGTLFLVRDSWAIDEGLIRKGGLGYTDEIEQPAELPYCSCFYEYVTSPRALPETLLTTKGREWVRGAAVRHDALERIAMRSRQVQGLDITIETAKGETRFGAGPDGTPWSVTMPADYGYLKWTMGADGEQIDCYVGPNSESPRAWVVDQLTLGGAFDEHKALIGFDTQAEALAAYLNGFSDGRGHDRVGAIAEMPLTDLARLQLAPA